jgi:hypothetical protein
MADEIAILTGDYRKKFGDFPPLHVNHGLDPEGALRDAIKTGVAIAEVLPGNTVQDDQ